MGKPMYIHMHVSPCIIVTENTWDLLELVAHFGKEIIWRKVYLVELMVPRRYAQVRKQEIFNG